MSGVPSAIGPLAFRAFRAAAYDLPEDFVRRLEPGLDPETVKSLEAGLRAVDRQRALWRWIAILGLLGLVATLLGGSVWAFGPVPEVGGAITLAGFAAIAIAGVALLAATGIGIVRRRDIRRLESFARAMHGSSLARDLS